MFQLFRVLRNLSAREKVLKRKSKSWTDVATEKCESEKKYPASGAGRPVNIVKEEVGGNNLS